MVWKTYKRTIKSQNLIEKNLHYDPTMPIQKKIHICDLFLPTHYEIMVRNKREVYAFDPIMQCLYGDDTEYPLGVVVKSNQPT